MTSLVKRVEADAELEPGEYVLHAAYTPGVGPKGPQRRRRRRGLSESLAVMFGLGAATGGDWTAPAVAVGVVIGGIAYGFGWFLDSARPRPEAAEIPDLMVVALTNRRLLFAGRAQLSGRTVAGWRAVPLDASTSVRLEAPRKSETERGHVFELSNGDADALFFQLAQPKDARRFQEALGELGVFSPT